MKKDRYIKKISDIFSSMGLTVLRGGIDYHSAKPDIIAIYDSISKCYIIEVMSGEQLKKNISTENDIASSEVSYNDYLCGEVISKLTTALKAIDDSEFAKYQLDSKVIYAGVITHGIYAHDIDRVLDYLDIEHKGLDIVDELHLQLISNEMTEKLKNSNSVTIEC